MKVTVFDSDLSEQANVIMLSPDEEALLGKIFFSLDVAREHPAVQHCLRDIQHQSFKVKNTLNAYTVFGKIWSYATLGHTNFHSSGTVYRARKAYLVHTGVLAALVQEFKFCRRNGGKTRNHQRVQRGGETLETQSQSPFRGLSSLPLPDNPVATVTTMTTQQFDVAPAVQYSVHSSLRSTSRSTHFRPGFSSIPSTSYSSSLGSPNPYPLPVSCVPPLVPQLALRHHHGRSGPIQYQNDFGENHGVQGVQLHSNQVHTGYEPRSEQNQEELEEDYCGDVYETFH